MGNCLGLEENSGLNQGLVPSGGMLVGAAEKPVDPDDPWKDWYYNDYDQPAMVDGRMQSGRWDMSRESFAGKLEEKQRIQQSLAQKAQLDKANAALAAQRASAGGQTPPQQVPQQQYRAPGGGAAGGAGTPGRPSKFGGIGCTLGTAPFDPLALQYAVCADSLPGRVGFAQWRQVLGLLVLALQGAWLNCRCW